MIFMKIRYEQIAAAAAGFLMLGVTGVPPARAEETKGPPPICLRTVKATVVAIDQPWMWNRLGAAQPGGILYALYGDVVRMDGHKLPEHPATLSLAELKELAGRVRLRDDKRPRPLVLRANKGDCLDVTFINLLAPDPAPPQAGAPPVPETGHESQRWALRQKRLQHEPVPQSADASATRWAGIHAAGLELIGSIQSDGSWVGRNAPSLAQTATAGAATPPAPGQRQEYRWYAAEEGTYLMYSPADMESGDQARSGLFGAINIEPEGAEWYRSQINHEDLERATLRGEDLKEYFRTLEEAPIPPQPAPKAHAATPAPEGKPMVLRNREPDKQKAVEVLQMKDGRLLTKLEAQPIIYYQAVYPSPLKPDPKSPCPRQEPKPVLQMLQAKAVGDALYCAPLTPELSGYTQELQDLDSGILPQGLLDIFARKLHVELSAAARVTDQYHHSWLITDRGSAYLVQATPGDGVYHLGIFKAELELIYSDLTAIITGPDAGRFSYGNNSPTFRTNPASPDRRQPYREYTIIYHQAFFTTQAFSQFQNDNMQTVLQAGGDNFAINYGSAAIGPEIVANRIGVGPMGNSDAVDLKFEEFFLSAWAVGDPAMVVDVPANAPNALVAPAGTVPQVRAQVPPGSPSAVLAGQEGKPRPPQAIPPQAYDFAPLSGAKATKAFYPDDPSNVYHSYMGDHVKFRILHAGPGPSHVHHLHAHQWLHSPDSDDGHYLDSQLIIPGSAYTLEITYGGSGNRNKTVGDSIFHCHFYPHFAQGMWALWRVHDVFEDGTVIGPDGAPLAGINRALPDGEIALGTPIPALVPLPTLAMAPAPAKVQLTNLAPFSDAGQGRRVTVLPEKMEAKLDAKGQPVLDGKGQPVEVPVYKSPGFPFFIPGVSGHRSPHPPLGFAWLEDPNNGETINDPRTGQKFYLDGGLPRHLVLDGRILQEYQTRWDFTKEFVAPDKAGKLHGALEAYELPEQGTTIEQAAMRMHEQRSHASALPNGDPGNFTLNGLPRTPGAPYADPSVTDQGNTNIHRRKYQAAAIEKDAVLNKAGWHFPQQRMLSLWQDVADVFSGKRPPQPLFFRSNTQDTIQFWHTNLVPNYYELDDFQVRTPTDIIGQHIHLVKFDVTASDGASNGFNYEDGTFSPEEVQGRIAAINDSGGLFSFDAATDFMSKGGPRQPLKVKPARDYYPPPGSNVDVRSGTPVVTIKGKPVEYPLFGQPPKPGEWDGAQTTVQLWAVDPLLNNEGEDRTLRTVFTHDHFSASTHQQAGLYAGLVVEPESSRWYLPDGTRMNTRLDGGPTSWHGYIVPTDPAESYREFMLEFQDMQLAYAKESLGAPSAARFDPRNPPDPAKAPPAPAFDVSQADLKTPQLTSGAMGYYAGQLNGGHLPVTQDTQVPSFPKLFSDFGLPLSDQATVKVLKKDEEWVIADPTVNSAGAAYVVRARHQSKIIDGVQVAVIVGMPVYILPPPSAAFDLRQATLPTPQLTSGAMRYYADQLNGGHLPVTKDALVPSLPDLFLNFGVPLSAQATVQVVKKDEEWVITETSEKNAGAEYVVRATFQTQSIEGVQVPVIVGMPVYTPGVHPGWSDAAFALNSPGDSTNTANGAPFPQLVSQNQVGTYSLNYRNDPLPFRVADFGADGSTSPKPAPFDDLSQVFASLARGGQPSLDAQPDGQAHLQPASPMRDFPSTPLVPNAQPGDPYTPLLEAYANDHVQVRTLVGAHTQSHAFEIQGVKWLFEPSSKNSGYRNAQLEGLSEHFELLFDLPGLTIDHPASLFPGGNLPPFADYFYSPSSDIVGLNNGVWGIMRAYASPVAGVQPLPSNPHPVSSGNGDFYQPPPGAPVRPIDITAVDAASALPGGKLVFNHRAGGPELSTPNGLLFVRSDDLDAAGQLRAGVPIEPLILRAAAGEWLKVTLTNKFTRKSPSFDPDPKSVEANGIANELPYATPFKGTKEIPSTLPVVPLRTSSAVGLHPQLISYDPIRSNGLVVGFNPTSQLVSPGASQTFYWYAGELEPDATGQKVARARPVEFGATNLLAGDQLLQPQFGLVGALIVEPAGSTWTEDVTTRASATVTKADGGQFRDFVVIDQNIVANSNSAVSPLNQAATNVVGAINFRSEPFTIRSLVGKSLPHPDAQGFARAFSDSLYKPAADPQTPVFVAPAGMPTRFRLLVPSTTTNNEIIAPPVFIVHGHNWQEEPYTDGSTRIGNNPLSEHFGAIQAGPNQKFDLVFDSAGGAAKVAGDYLYTTYQTAGVLGTWGLFRVTNQEIRIDTADLSGSSLRACGTIRIVTPSGTDPLPKQLQVLASDDANAQVSLGTVNVGPDGAWSLQATTNLKAPVRIQVSATLESYAQPSTPLAGATAVRTIGAASAVKTP